MQETLMVLLVIGAFAVVFPLFWMGVVYLISRVGGWAELAKRFGSDAPEKGELFTWCSARLRVLCSYSNCLRVSLSDTGIHIRTLIFFKFGHRPLFIPWAAVRGLQVRRFWRYSSAKLTVQDQTGNWSATIVLYGWGLADRLK
ncbi:unnamed protein product, partial [Discosporangium mesarthrocarpum]